MTKDELDDILRDHTAEYDRDTGAHLCREGCDHSQIWYEDGEYGCATRRLARTARDALEKLSRVEAQRDDWRERAKAKDLGRPGFDEPEDVMGYYRSVLEAAAARLDEALA